MTTLKTAVFTPIPIARLRPRSPRILDAWRRLASGVSHVTKRRLEKRQSLSIAIGLFHALDATKPRQREPVSLARLDSAPHQIVDVQRDVALELVVQLAIVMRPRNRGSRRDAQTRGAPSRALLTRRQKAREDRGRLIPLARGTLDSFPAGPRQLVELRAAVVVGGAPLGRDRAFLFELEQGRIERAVVDGEQVAAGLLDPAGDAVAMQSGPAFRGS